MDNYSEYDALGLADLIARKDVSAVEVLSAAMARAKTAKETFNCFTHIAEPETVTVPDEGPFAGVPFAMKDLGAEVEGFPLTSGSNLFKDKVSGSDGVFTSRLRKAGLSIFGVTNSPEFGLTTTTESRLHGQTKNPWDMTRTSGGSSGGASAAVSAGVLPIAHASDGGGSIRIPAACCGLFGMKPSRGRVPMGPHLTEGWTGHSTVGFVSRSVRDSAALLDVIHGREVGSRYSAPEPMRPYSDEIKQDPKPLKIAFWPDAPSGVKPDADASAGLKATVELLESLGHIVEEAAPPLDGELLAKSFIFNISANIAALVDDEAKRRGRDLTDEDLEKVTAAMANLGRSVPMVELARANNAFVKAAIVYEQFLIDNSYDMTLSATLSRAPHKLGVLSLESDDMAEAAASFAPHCAHSNQMGTPAMSVPLHWTQPTETASKGLPIGMMFGAKCGQEGLLFSLARQLEQAKPWKDKTPPLWIS